MVYIWYSILWVSMLLFTGWLYIEAGTLHVLWLLAIPIFMSPGERMVTTRKVSKIED